MINHYPLPSLPPVSCLIVDDDATSRLVLEHYIRRTPGLELVASLADGAAGLQYLRSGRQVDLLFLDLAMPELNGVELLRQLLDPPAVVITTALTDFAHVGELPQVTDYLVKPIRFARFYQAMQRVLSSVAAVSPAVLPVAPASLPVSLPGLLLPGPAAG